jgi:drug/metabolite transporter (DMT)-like permease
VKRLTSWFHFQPLLAVTLWGGIYPGAKLGLREMPALSFTYLCILLAVIVLFAVSGSIQPFRFPWTLWQPLLQARLAQTVFQFLLIAGLQRTTAGNSAILLATAPLLTAGWLALTRREHLGSRRWFGLVAGFVGVAVVVQGGGIDVTGSRLSGDLLTLGAAGAWAWYGIVIGPLVGTLGALRATGWTMVIAALCFTPTLVRRGAGPCLGERLVGGMGRIDLRGDGRHGHGWHSGGGRSTGYGRNRRCCMSIWSQCLRWSSLQPCSEKCYVPSRR